MSALFPASLVSNRLARRSARHLRGVSEAVLSPCFARLIQRHPDLTTRLGRYAESRFWLKPRDLPVGFLMRPSQQAPTLALAWVSAVDASDWDACVSGALPDLVAMVDGQLDGDALFFSRALSIAGDTQAVLALRNAVDAEEMQLAAEIDQCFGLLSGPIGFGRRQLWWLLKRSGLAAAALSAVTHLTGNTDPRSSANAGADIGHGETGHRRSAHV